MRNAERLTRNPHPQPATRNPQFGPRRTQRDPEHGRRGTLVKVKGSWLGNRDGVNLYDRLQWQEREMFRVPKLNMSSICDRPATAQREQGLAKGGCSKQGGFYRDFSVSSH